MEKCFQIYITFKAFTDNFDLKNIALQSIEVHDKPLQMGKKLPLCKQMRSRCWRTELYMKVCYKSKPKRKRFFFYKLLFCVGFSYILSFQLKKIFQNKCIPPRWGRRMRALFWTPVLMMNFLSSFTFFAGLEVGKIYACRFLIEGNL